MARKKKVLPAAVEPVQAYIEGVAKSLVDRNGSARQFAQRSLPRALFVFDVLAMRVFQAVQLFLQRV